MKGCNSCVKLLILFPQRNLSLPDDTNVARLQEELIAVKLREAEALTGLKELRQQVRDLEDHWQVSTYPLKVIHVFVWQYAADNWPCYLLSASFGTDCRPLERQPKEEHIKWTAGRADEREAARSWGPGGAAREQTEAAGDGDAGQSSHHTAVWPFSFIHTFMLWVTVNSK